MNGKTMINEVFFSSSLSLFTLQLASRSQQKFLKVFSSHDVSEVQGITKEKIKVLAQSQAMRALKVTRKHDKSAATSAGCR